MNQQSLTDFIWSVADLLRGDFTRPDFGRRILPFTLRRRLECVPVPIREPVQDRHKVITHSGLDLDLIRTKI
jgi:type I restriction enzyme M protein